MLFGICIGEKEYLRNQLNRLHGIDFCLILTEGPLETRRALRNPALMEKHFLPPFLNRQDGRRIGPGKYISLVISSSSKKTYGFLKMLPTKISMGCW